MTRSDHPRGAQHTSPARRTDALRVIRVHVSDVMLSVTSCAPLPAQIEVRSEWLSWGSRMAAVRLWGVAYVLLAATLWPLPPYFGEATTVLLAAVVAGQGLTHWRYQRTLARIKEHVGQLNGSLHQVQLACSRMVEELPVTGIEDHSEDELARVD